MNYPIVHVVWHDAFSRDAWRSVSELIETDHAIIDSVGYLIRNDKKYVALSACVSREDEQHEDEACCTIVIPKGMIVSMKVLVKSCARSKR